jgi:hypothetical protein
MRNLDIFVMTEDFVAPCDFFVVFLSSHFVVIFKVANKSEQSTVCYLNDSRHYLKLKRVCLHL